jgi:hypothetical protein
MMPGLLSSFLSDAGSLRKLAAWLERSFDAGSSTGKTGARSSDFLKIVPMNGLDTLSIVELDAPTTRGPLSDDNTLKIAVSGVPR